MTDSTILTQSNSAIKRQARIDNANQRNFGGKLSDFTDNKERHFNQRMLKAYLNGKPVFNFGFEKNVKGEIIRALDGKPIPKQHDVIKTDKTIDHKKLDALLAGGYCDHGKVFGGVSLGKGQLKKMLRKREADRIKALKAKKKEKGFLGKFGL